MKGPCTFALHEGWAGTCDPYVGIAFQGVIALHSRWLYQKKVRHPHFQDSPSTYLVVNGAHFTAQNPQARDRLLMGEAL